VSFINHQHYIEPHYLYILYVLANIYCFTATFTS
jgi:hypothetical protein